ncbi:hypothetical protein FCV25MIE_17851 [Fagus crenata]
MEEITRMCDSMSLTAKEGGRVDLSDSQEVLGGLLVAKFLTKRVVNLELSPDKQEYGPWLRGELPQFPCREWSGRVAPSRDYSSSEDKGYTTPAQSSGVAAQNTPNMDKPKITPYPNVVTEPFDFQAKLKEIDRELGLENGEINETMELLMQSDSQAKFQNHKAGDPCGERNKVRLVEDEPIRPQFHGPVVDPCGHQKSARKPTGSTWKRIACPNMEAFDMAQQTCKTQQKRSQNALPEEEIVRSVKKTKAVGNPSNTSMVEILAEVAMQPRRTP